MATAIPALCILPVKLLHIIPNLKLLLIILLCFFGSIFKRELDGLLNSPTTRTANATR